MSKKDLNQMEEKELYDDAMNRRMAGIVDSIMEQLGAIPDVTPQVIATVVGNIVSNVAGSFCVKFNNVEAGGEIMAAIVVIARKSIDMYLEESNMDVDGFHDAYIRNSITIAGTLKRGVLIKSKLEKPNE